MNRWRGVIEEYRKFLPVSERTPVISLLEGNTPLIRAVRLAQAIAPGIDLYLKFEGVNPTGSFKDRGMTLAISMCHGYSWCRFRPSSVRGFSLM